MLGGLIGDGHQGIETSIARASKQDSVGCLVLDQKEERMKFNEDTIIIGKAMYRQEIFGSIGNMQDIAKMKILSRVMNNGMTNIAYFHTLSTRCVDLFIPGVVITDS